MDYKIIQKDFLIANENRLKEIINTKIIIVDQLAIKN
jgi:hypothetical protein